MAPTTKDFRKTLEEEVLLADGAIGTLLTSRGASPDQARSPLNLSDPDSVREVHEDYLGAGARIVTTNTWDANRMKLTAHEWADSLEKINREGVRRSFEWLARGGVLVVFPAGRVARFSWRRMRTAEQPWNSRIAAVARETQTKVLPVYFHGHNDWFFQVVGMLHPALQDLLFVREFTNKRGQTLRATIGPLIEPAELMHFASDDDASQFLRQETEKLSQL